jgi:hypothetical protein
MLGDVSTIRGAAMESYTLHGDFPQSGEANQIPTELEPLLPDGFQTGYETASYRWHRWSLSGGIPGFPGAAAFAALEIWDDDMNRMAALKKL